MTRRPETHARPGQGSSVTINNIGDPGEANQTLRDAGVRAVVMVPSPPKIAR
jgi:hypothetical protein